MASGTVTTRIDYRPPYCFADLLAFFGDRALPDVETVENGCYTRTVRIPAPGGSMAEGWVRVANDDLENQLVVTIPEALANTSGQITERVSRMFDIGCDPTAVTSGLAPLDKAVPGSVKEGVRLPGCFDVFETACRAVLGQQISVTAARSLAARIVARYGAPIESGIEGLSRAWPTPADVLAFESAEDAFGELGVIKTRSRVIAEMARLLEAGELDFEPSASAEKQMERLLSIKGVGPWTANYIAMRVMSYPDAFLETDVGVKHALPGLTPAERLATAESWRPWRSYAVVSLWNSLAD